MPVWRPAFQAVAPSGRPEIRGRSRRVVAVDRGCDVRRTERSACRLKPALQAVASPALVSDAWFPRCPSRSLRYGACVERVAVRARAVRVSAEGTGSEQLGPGFNRHE